MSCSPTSSPVPEDHRAWSYLVQRDFWRERGIVGDFSFMSVADNLRDGITATCHRFGVNIAKGRIYFTGERVAVIIALEAGEWNEVFSFRTTVRGNPAGRVCAKILRLLDASHEKLG